MTFSDIVTEVTSIRFNGNYVANAKNWINMNYGYVWNSQDWTFAWGQTTVSVTGGSSTLATPADFGQVSYLWTDTASPISYLTPQEFFKTFYASTTTGIPSYYTVVNGVVSLGPTPASSSSTYQLVYQKKWTKLVNDADVPLIPEEYHYMLVHGALRTGLVTQNDFTYAQQQEQFQMMLQSMSDSYTTDHGGTLQYQADGLGQSGGYALGAG